MTLQISTRTLRYLWVLFSFLIGCSGNNQSELRQSGQNKVTQPLFALVSPQKSNVLFNNQIKEDYTHFFFDFNYVYNGGGVAVGDINNDGLSDIYFTGNQVENKLYLNKGNFVFEDITASALVGGSEGWHNGVVMADVNSDGWLDIYLCKGGFKDTDEERKNTLYINQGDLTFEEQAAKYHLDDVGFSTMAVFFDMDNDNDLDMYLVNRPEKFHLGYEQVLQGKKKQHDLYRDKLYLNEHGKFSEIGIESGIVNNFGYGLGLVASDINNDGLSDVFVSNDYYENDYLYINQGNLQFKERIKQFTNHIPFYAMGVDVVDINNDGLEDIIELEMSSDDHVRSKTTMAAMDVQLFKDMQEHGFHKQYMHNMLHLNLPLPIPPGGEQRGGHFSEIGQLAGIASTDWSWSCLGSDFDNDGYRDIFIGNGFLRDIWDKDTNEKVKRYIQSKAFRLKPRQESAEYIIQQYKPNKLPNYIYRNNGDLTFTNKVAGWGLTQASFSNGAAVGDLDNDGDLDLIVNNINDPAFIYENKAEHLGHHFIKIKLDGPTGNTSGLGTKITITTKNGIQYHEFKTVRGYLSSVEPVIHFGLGEINEIDKVQVTWTDGTTYVSEKVAANQTLVISYDTSSKVYLSEDKVIKPIFYEATKEYFQEIFEHQENDYDDYKDQILLPHKLSQNGPCISVADVNGDGLDDFFVGGAHGQAGEIFIQQIDGTFLMLRQTAFEHDKGHEDVGAAFFDMDQDGDQDLYVVSGGNEVMTDAHYYQDRLYLNDGNGQFKNADLLPNITSSGSCVVPHDFDQDGDIDLFVGGRVIPGKYPNAPASWLLRNEKGRFTDVTEQLAPELKRTGMVTSAAWADINRDGIKELMVVGEWMPITVFQQEKGQFINRTKSYQLAQTSGWWNKIEPADIDRDGDIDFIVGNLGLNYKFHASKDKPFMVFANDFDTNGTNDVFLAKYYHDKIVPVRGKDCSSEQLPILNRKFSTYNAFAQADINQILGEKISDATQYKADIFESVILENRNGILVLQPLPVHAQFSTVNGIVIHDFNEDRTEDILIAGNKFEVEVETTPADASPGYLLIGKEDKHYQALPPNQSGFFVPENVKDIQLVKTNSIFRWGVLVAINNGEIKYFLPEE